MKDFFHEQQQVIRAAEETLDIGPVELAGLIGTPYNTLKDWKSGRRKMPDIGFRAIELVVRVRAAGLEN